MSSHGFGHCTLEERIYGFVCAGYKLLPTLDVLKESAEALYATLG